MDAVNLIKSSSIKLGMQMMVGLPESTRLDELNTAKDLIKLPKGLYNFEHILKPYFQL